MLDAALSSLLASQKSRPLSVAVTIAALFLPTTLTILLSSPRLVGALGLGGTVLISSAISLPIVLLCFAIWYTPLMSLLKVQRIASGLPESPEGDLAEVVNAEDPLEWTSLLSGGWTANTVLYFIAALAYRHPLRIGATFLLTALLLFIVWLMLFVLSIVMYAVVQRKVKRVGPFMQPTSERRQP